MRPNLTVVTLATDDLARAVRFYESGLKLKVANQWREQHVAFVPMSGVVLALWPRAEFAGDVGTAPEGSGFRGVSLAHNATSRAEVDAVLRDAREAGARIAKPAHETFWGGYSAYFEDPDPHLWEVAHNPFWTLDADGRVAKLAPG
ncbi:MAG TPA: VOC family protein [Candidatus Thermoplasmatota archaeon]|nr:VOC family protein [Candidatus Thermoplasmatota archaeon]